MRAVVALMLPLAASALSNIVYKKGELALQDPAGKREQDLRHPAGFFSRLQFVLIILHLAMIDCRRGRSRSVAAAARVALREGASRELGLAECESDEQTSRLWSAEGRNGGAIQRQTWEADM